MPKLVWSFITDPPDQSSSEGDWDALDCGYLRPEVVLADQEQIKLVRDAEALLHSFFQACRSHGVRQEM